MDRPYSIEYPEPSGPPQLTTFYSFKGGVGRTQSLYNVGVRLAALRRKVLMVDVDLEAPGLSIGALEEKDRNSKDGFSEIASDLLSDLRVTIDEGDPDLFAEVVADYQERLDRALHVIDVPMPPRQEGLAERLRDEMGVTNLPTGSLALLSSGRIDPDYPRKMIDVEIDEAFEQELNEEQRKRLPKLLDKAGLDLPGVPHNRGLVFTAVLRYLLRNATDPQTEDRFRHVLIDSRSGLADVGGLCLRGLPDTRVVLSGLNKQNLEGTRMVLDTLSREERADNELIVVFSPVPEGEANLVDERIATAKDRLTFRDPNGEDRISEDQIQLLHYHPRIALEETPFTESFHRRTRIYDEYETLTDDLLALTGSDARSLVSDALERFREDNEDQDEASTGGKEENRYLKLASELIPAAFLNEDHVESTLDGLCTQLRQEGPYKSDATGLFDLWVALSPDEFRVLGTTADFYNAVKREVSSENVESILRRSLDLEERITEKKPEESYVWYNWGIGLTDLAQFVQEEDPDHADSLYRKAFNKYRKAVDIKPEYHKAWYNWGTNLGRLARLVQDNNSDQAESLYQKAFDKYQEAVRIEPDDHETWGNWGTDLGRLAQLVQDDNLDRADALYSKAFDKFHEASEINSSEHKIWGNWGFFLTHWSRVLRSQNKNEEVQEALTNAIEKLKASLSTDGGLRPLYWLIVALAERDANGDIEEAAKKLDAALEEVPTFTYWFEDEDAETVRDHPELREILDAYRQQVDEAEVEEAENPEELDAPSLIE